MSYRGILIIFRVQDTITGAHIKGELALNKVPILKILVSRREGYSSYSFIFIIINLLEVGEFFFFIYILDLGFWSGGEDGTIGTIVACLLAVKAKTFLNTNLSFLWSELPNAYSIYYRHYSFSPYFSYFSPFFPSLSMHLCLHFGLSCLHHAAIILSCRHFCYLPFT